jgi:hypothetical protein
MTTIGNDDVHGTESTTDGVFVVLVDDDNVDTVGRRRRVDVGRLGEQHQNASGHRRGPVTYGSMVDGGDEEEVDDDDDDDDDDDLGLLLSSKEERRRTTRGARALATVGVAALAASGCGRALAAVRESGTPTMRSGYDVEENVMLRSVSGWDAATAANQLARNFGRVGSRGASS